MNSGNSFAEGYAIGRDSNGSNSCNNGMGWGMDGWWGFLIIALLFGFGGWGNGNWGGGNGGAQFLPYAIGANGALTRSDLCSEFAFNDLQNAVRGVQQGICDSTFALNNSITSGFAGVNSAICNLGYEQAQLANQTQMAIMQGNNALATQLADCCCKTQTAIGGVQNAITGLGCSLGREIERGFADTNYNMATNTCALQTSIANSTRDIIDSQNAGTRAVLDWLCAKETADLRAENQALRLSASQSAQNAAIGAMINASEANIIRRTGNDCPIPAYVVPNPNCCYGPYGNGYGYGYNNNCGCNSGCGC